MSYIDDYPGNNVMKSILMLDDRQDTAADLMQYLEDNGFEGTVITTLSDAKKMVDFQRHSMLIMRLSAHEDALEGMIHWIAELTRANKHFPVIVVADRNQMSLVIRSMRVGAWDFLLSPIKDNLTGLEHAVCRALDRVRIAEENVAYQKELENLNHQLNDSLEELQADQMAGRVVQEQLLPPESQRCQHFTITHRVQPSLYLSGDFVDHFELDEAHYAFYLADVSGHGSSSAFVTILIKSLMTQWLAAAQNQTSDRLYSPKDVLSALAKEILTLGVGKYATMIYGVIDTKKNQLCYSIGGHHPLPILRSKGKSHFFGGKSFPVGVYDKAQYDNQTFDLHPGDLLALFSDGVFEVMPEMSLADKEQYLSDKVQAYQEEGLDHLLTQLGVQENKARPDDITALLVQYPTSK